MIKKLVIGGTAAALVVAGAASAAQLKGVNDTMLAGNQVSVSGAELEGIEFGHTYVGYGPGNAERRAVVSTVTVDLDKSDVTVQGRLLQEISGKQEFATSLSGSKGGYLADNVDTKFDGKVTDADGKVTFDLTWQQIPVENIDAIDIVVTD